MPPSMASPRPILCAFLYPPPRCLTASAARCASATATVRPLSTRQLRSERVYTAGIASRHRRPYSTTPARLMDRAQAAASRIREGSVTRLSKEAMKDSIAQQGAHLDLGLMPGTLVMPHWRSSALPSLLSAGRLRLEYRRAKQRGQDLLGLLYYKFFTGVRGLRNKPKMFPKDMEESARRLHWDLWTAFAEGDLAALRQTCASGLYNDLSRKVRRRAAGERSAWRLVEYTGRPRLMSDRAASIPETDGVALRQVVIRIRSRQSLEKQGRGRKKGEGEGQEPEVREIEEYLVLQRILGEKKVEHPWVVWGTTQESDVQPLAAGA